MTAASQALTMNMPLVPVGSIDSYIYQVNQIPLLSAEEELEFARRFQEEGDLECARQLVLSHLRYVVRVAKGYLGYGLALNDLIQEGNLGLMKAVKRFDPKVGVRLVSFAIHWIKAEIHEFVLHNWRIVKVATTKAQRKLFFNMRQMKKTLGRLTQEEVNTVATDLNVSTKEVLTMAERLNAVDMSFDVDDSEDDEQNYKASPVNFLHDAKYDPARVLEADDSEGQSRDRLQFALTQLDDRSREIIAARWLCEDNEAETLHTLAERYGISAERVRQLEKNAMKKVRHLMEQ